MRQSLDVQVAQLRDAGCTKLFEEKVSGTSQQGRVQLAAALDYVREGDTFIVTRLDRLARSMSDLRDIVDRLMEKDVAFKAIQQGAIDTTTSGGRLMLNMLADVNALLNEGIGATEIARRPGIARASVYRARSSIKAGDASRESEPNQFMREADRP